MSVMAGIDVRSTMNSSEHDAFPFVVANASGSVNSFECNISDFIETLNFPDTSGISYSSSDSGADKNIPLLPDKNCNDNKQNVILCKTESNCCGLGRDSKILKCDRDPADLLGFSCNNSDSMKFKDGSELGGSGVFSDLLSSDRNPTKNSGFHGSDCNINHSSICVPELKEELTASGEESNGNKEGSYSDSVFNLSDILSSISLDDDRQQRSNSLRKSSFEICDESLSLDDFKIASNESPIVKNNNSKKDEVNLSDFLSSLDFPTIDSNKSDSKFTSITQGDEKRNEGFTALNCQTNNSVHEVNVPQFDIDDLIKDVSPETDDKLLGPPVGNKQPHTFSFFSNSSENALPFFEMFNKDCKKDPSKHEQYSVSGDSGISMMDFLNSLENAKEISTSSDNSDGLSSPLGSTLEEEEEFEAIDLNSCIKSFEDKAIFSMKESCDTPDLRKTPEHLSPEDILPLPLQHSVIPTYSRKGMKKSLFAKSLSCKPKKDLNLLFKVASIKTDLFNQVFGRPALLNVHRKNPLPDIAKYSDTPTVPYAGHKSYDRSGFTFVC